MPSPDPQLVEMFRSVRSDARNDPKPTEMAIPFTVEFCFDGVTQLPTAGDVLIVPMGRISARIVGASIVADASGSAAIDLRIGTATDWPTTVAVYDSVPTLSSAARVTLTTTNWRTAIQPTNILIAKLTSVSGSLTTLTLAVECIRLKWPPGAYVGLKPVSGPSNTALAPMTTRSTASTTSNSPSVQQTQQHASTIAPR